MHRESDLKLKDQLDQFLVKIELDARKAGLCAIAIKNLQEDCKKVINRDPSFQI